MGLQLYAGIYVRRDQSVDVCLYYASSDEHAYDSIARIQLNHILKDHLNLSDSNLTISKEHVKSLLEKSSHFTVFPATFGSEGFARMVVYGISGRKSQE